MDHANTGTPAETILRGALELSKNSCSWHSTFPIERSRVCIRSEAGYGKADGKNSRQPAIAGPR